MIQNEQAAFTPPVVERLHGALRAKIAAGVMAGAVLVASACSTATEVQTGAPIATKSGTVPEQEVDGPNIFERFKDAAEQAEADKEVCEGSWEVVGVDHGPQNKWFGEGITSIRNAVTDEEAMAAAAAWIYGVDGPEGHPGISDDEKLFAEGYNLFKAPENPAIVAADLVDEDSCATEAMVDARIHLETRLASSKITAVEEIPADVVDAVVNTGTDGEGNVTVADAPGVYGDTKSLRVELPDGTVIYILARCGQPVLPGNPAQPLLPNVPKGPTDNPHNPKKTDDGRLPGDPNVPADQDRGTPDNPGQGPVGQTPGDDGYLPTESVPTVPQQPTTPRPTNPQPTTPATTSPNPVVTSPPVIITTPPTTRPDPVMPVEP